MGGTPPRTPTSGTVTGRWPHAAEGADVSPANRGAAWYLHRACGGMSRGLSGVVNWNSERCQRHTDHLHVSRDLVTSGFPVFDPTERRGRPIQRPEADWRCSVDLSTNEEAVTGTISCAQYQTSWRAVVSGRPMPSQLNLNVCNASFLGSLLVLSASCLRLI